MTAGSDLEPMTRPVPGHDELPGIGLDALNARASLMTRVDRKYLVPTTVVGRLLSDLADQALVLDIAGRRTFGYRSTYYDTADLASFRDAAGRRRRRFKVRRRDYLHTETSFLEVKTCTGRGASRKQRIPVRRGDLTDGHLDFVRGALAEAACPAPTSPLQPVLATTYDRTTILLERDTARITIDEHLSWQSVRHGPSGPGHLVPDLVVIETKSGQRPGAADHYLWDHGHRPTRLSKYATGMALLDPALTGNRWHRTLQRLRAEQGTTPRSTR